MKARIILYKTGPDLCLNGLVRFWPNGSGPEASHCARMIRPGSGRLQPVSHFQTIGRSQPVSHFQTIGRSQPVSHFQTIGRSQPVSHFQTIGRSQPVSHFQTIGRSQPVSHFDYWQITTGFPLSDYAAVFHRQPRSYCAKPSQI